MTDTDGQRYPALNTHRPPARRRLILGIDATGSREMTWQRASQWHGELFQSAERDVGLQVQLCYYRGQSEFVASDWQQDPDQLRRDMNAVSCLGGHTQIARLLRHALAQCSDHPVSALVFIGDAMEESSEVLFELASRCQAQGLPLLLFQEGYDPIVKHCFAEMARLSGGAHLRFNQSSARRLRECLQAAAAFAGGGVAALKSLRHETASELLLQLGYESGQHG